MTRQTLKLAFLAAACVAALSACKDDDRQAARIAVPDPGPLGYIADGGGLAYAPPARVQPYRQDLAYSWAERAYTEQRAFYDEPPAYGFDYDDRDAWVWRTADDWAMYAEPWDDGYRYYYYEPGAAYPYFVRDDDYGYGYDPTGVLVAVFDVTGAYLAPDRLVSFAPIAGRYWSRGHDLRSTALRAPRITVNERDWSARAPVITRTSEPWLRAGERHPGWTSWRSHKGKDRLQTAGSFPELRAALPPGLARQEERHAIQAQRKFAREDVKAERRAEHAAELAQRRMVREARQEPPRRAFDRPVAAEAHGRPASAVEPFRGPPVRRDHRDGGYPHVAVQDQGGGNPHPQVPNHGGGNPHAGGGHDHGGGAPQGNGGQNPGAGKAPGGGNPRGGGDGDKGHGDSHGHGKKG